MERGLWMRGSGTSGSPTDGIDFFFVSSQVVSQAMLEGPDLEERREGDRGDNSEDEEE
jgi:hypothetical protein